MSDTNDTPTCPDCGTALPADSPGGACPVCLMGAGLASAEPDAAPPRVPTSPEELGELFPELEILEEVGRGGMGIVWKARQKALDRVVALKILTVGGDDAPAFAERFGREARALARLDHPNIVRVIEFGERDGVYFLTMDFVDGATLREAIDDGGLQPEQALTIVPQICDALQYAHDQGVVHRDIKPENVLLDKDSRVRIADFGLAKLSAGGVPEVTLTRAGQVMGTLHYMAPEQIESPLLVDHRADIYSLGVVFYEMLTGELPIGRFDPPSDRVQLDVRLDDVVLRALSKRRERRYQTAAEVKNEVTTISTTDGASAAAAAMAARVAPPREHRAEPEAPQDRRWSRKAILGFLLPWIGTALAFGSVALLALFAGGGNDPNIGAGLLGLALVGSMLLGGLVLSIWGWVDIARSDGRLKGLWLAILGCIQGLCFPLGVLPLVAMIPVRSTYVGETEPQVDTVLLADKSVHAVFEDYKFSYRGKTLEERIEATDPRDRASLPHRVPDSKDSIDALTNGLAFVPDAAIPGRLFDYEIQSTQFLMEPNEVEVRVTNGTHVIQFRIVVRDGRNYFDRVPVLIGPREDFEAR